MFNKALPFKAQGKPLTEPRKGPEIASPSMLRMTLTVEEAAEELNISRPTAYNLVKEEGFPALTIGHRVLINRAGLQRWLDSKSGLQVPEST